ncbi:DUF6308 family protein [Pseudarthrobacter sp. AB1]|uniref:DUF6308 family protein n=1 Tax=Pseudarthrobacter sp. AB1 TaxID=2138309 RepID=UPI00186B9716|nr:DUF6308 family protein [Pseudarthrobacter sp. AB1]MBE4720139.1 hypothetical protein [Pseudarthrobacter sp. AB1]
MDLPDILSDQDVKAAAKLLHRYYLEPDKQGLLSTGSYFDEWAGRGDMESRDVITDSDAVAVSMLSVTVPAKAIVGLAEPETAARITELLEQIPTNVPLSRLSSEKAAALLTGRGPAALLWTELRRTKSNRWGIGATTASKIMARKRPHLIPIWDEVIGQVIRVDSSTDQWMNWHRLLTDGTGLPERLTEIHRLSEVELRLSELRIMDVVLWRHGKDQGFGGRGGAGRR